VSDVSQGAVQQAEMKLPVAFGARSLSASRLREEET
jgi:hypothetical protein